MNLRFSIRAFVCILTLAPLSIRADEVETAALDGAAAPQAPRPLVRDASDAERSRGQITLRPFYRHDDLRFNIDGGGLDIISELDWDDVRSAGLQIEGNVRLPGPFELRGDLSSGRVFDGHLRVSDYNGPGKTLEFSRSRSDTERGSTLDASLAIGVPFSGRRWRAVPLLGVTYGEQNYNLRNGFQIVPASGAFGGLDSDYETRWLGVLWGLELHWLPGEDWDLMARLTSRHADYDADGHFKLRRDLAQPRSFGQSTIGRGSVLELAAKRELGAGFTLDLSTRWDDWDTRHGKMEFFFASGGSSRQGLNEVKLESFRVALGQCRGDVVGVAGAVGELDQRGTERLTAEQLGVGRELARTLGQVVVQRRVLVGQIAEQVSGLVEVLLDALAVAREALALALELDLELALAHAAVGEPGAQGDSCEQTYTEECDRDEWVHGSAPPRMAQRLRKLTAAFLRSHRW